MFVRAEGCGVKLTLTKEQRAAFFAGDCPHIGGKGECPVEVGYIYRLSASLHFRVSKINTDRDGWWINYVVQDRRHTVRNLRRTPSPTDFDSVRESFDEYGYPPEATEDAIEDAGQESSYTSRGVGLVDDAGEAIDAATTKRYADKAAESSARLRQQRMEEAKQTIGSIKEMQLSREAKRRMRRIEHDLAAIEAEVSEAA